MSKKSILLSFLFLSLLLFPLRVFAEDTASPSSSVNMTIKDKLMQAREETKTAIQEQRDLVKAKIAALKDQRKKTIVERVNTRIPEINTNRTTQMNAALARMSQMLDAISSKSAVAKQNGKNTTSLDQAISSARAAVTTAQDAVTVQSEKVYTLSITSESTLKTTVGATLKQLTSDLQATHKKVIAAREAVRKALTELAKLGGIGPKEGKEKTATEAAQ